MKDRVPASVVGPKPVRVQMAWMSVGLLWRRGGGRTNREREEVAE